MKELLEQPKKNGYNIYIYNIFIFIFIYIYDVVRCRFSVMRYDDDMLSIYIVFVNIYIYIWDS